MEIGSPEWYEHSYGVKLDVRAGTGKDSRALEGCREIFLCAYREFHPETGGSGGPAGVLAMQRQILGGWLGRVRLHYIFKPEGNCVPDGIWETMSQLSWTVKNVFAAAGYLMMDGRLRESLAFGKAPLLICHEMGFAYGAYLMKVPYILIYHQQGSLAWEAESMGRACPAEEKKTLDELETAVFQNARKVYFPSKGAKKVFEETTQMSAEELGRCSFSSEPLYNTIAEEAALPGEDILEKLGIGRNLDEELFVSIGDYVAAKGMDLVPRFLDAYVSETGRKAIWVAAGNASNEAIWNRMMEEREGWKFQAVLFGERLRHEVILQLLRQADFYIMLHRKSIFDIATLEAMHAGCRVILSGSGGNREFDVNGNILFADGGGCREAALEAAGRDGAEWGRKNKEAYQRFFSNGQFAKRCIRMIREGVCASLENGRVPSEVNRRNLSRWKGRYAGQTAVVCGSGSSLEALQGQESGVTYIALNKALFYRPIRFDFLFMQDYPQGRFPLEEYNAYDCVKFYGIITNPNVRVRGLGKEDEEFPDVRGEVYRYELSPRWFDHRTDSFEGQIGTFCLSDAQSVLFSALQFARFAGFRTIILYGVDFSGCNYGKEKNASKYVACVMDNLLAIKRQFSESQCELRVGATDNLFIKNELSESKKGAAGQ